MRDLLFRTRGQWFWEGSAASNKPTSKCNHVQSLRLRLLLEAPFHDTRHVQQVIYGDRILPDAQRFSELGGATHMTKLPDRRIWQPCRWDGDRVAACYLWGCLQQTSTDHLGNQIQWFNQDFPLETTILSLAKTTESGSVLFIAGLVKFSISWEVSAELPSIGFTSRLSRIL